jgi:hypothetical protein
MCDRNCSLEHREEPYQLHRYGGVGFTPEVTSKLFLEE